MDGSAVVDALATAFSAIDEAVLVIGHEPRTIVACNAAAERVFGYGASEMIGQTTRLLHVDDAHFAEFARRGDPALRGTGVFRAAFAMRRKDGTVFETLNTVVLLHRERGIPGGAVSIIRDASEVEGLRRRLAESEDRLLRSQKLALAGRLAAGLVHDLNNYLTVVAGNLESLAEGPLDAGQRESVETMAAAIEGASGLNQRLGAFVRPQGTRAAAPAGSLNDVLEGCERLVRTVLGAGTALRMDLDEAVGRVRLDASAVEQVLLNLAVNARDAMPQGGTLHVRTRRVAAAAPALAGLGPPPPGEHALLEVRDTGTGMSAELEARIFEPFFTTKAPDRGSGLGLLAVSELVRSAGGQVRVTSAPGEGTTFRILLPRL